MPNFRTTGLVRSVVVCVVIVVLNACASVPLLTMWKLRSFNGNELKTLNPDDVRVAVRLSDQIRLEPEKTTLDVTLTPRASQEPPVHEKAGLVLVTRGRSVPADVPVAPADEIWYLMKLSPEGIKSFREFQQRLNPDMEHHYKSFRILTNTNWTYASVHENEQYHFTVWLQMTPQQGYFELLDDAPFTINTENQDHASPSASR